MECVMKNYDEDLASFLCVSNITTHILKEQTLHDTTFIIFSPVDPAGSLLAIME